MNKLKSWDKMDNHRHYGITMTRLDKTKSTWNRTSKYEIVKINHGGVGIKQTTTIDKCHGRHSMYESVSNRQPEVSKSSPFNYKINRHFNSSDEIAGSNLTIKTVFMNGDFNHRKLTNTQPTSQRDNQRVTWKDLVARSKHKIGSHGLALRETRINLKTKINSAIDSETKTAHAIHRAREMASPLSTLSLQFTKVIV